MRSPRGTLQGWLERGRDLEDVRNFDERDQVYVDLADAVLQAHASARLKAEATVWKRTLLDWLRFGPGRDRGPECPGWTKAVGEAPAEVRSAAEILLAQALAQLRLVPEPVAVPSIAQPMPALGSAGVEDGEEVGD